MTGNIRHSLGLLVAAVVVALLGLVLMTSGVPQMEDVGALTLMGAVIVAIVGLVRLAAELLRSPQRD